MTSEARGRQEIEAFVREYFAALARGEIGGNETLWYTPDILATDWPSGVDPRGAVRDLAALQYFFRRKPLPCRELFVEDVLVDGYDVAVRFSERLDAASSTAPSQVAIASGAVFLHLRGRRICRQQTYRCMPPSWAHADETASDAHGRA